MASRRCRAGRRRERRAPRLRVPQGPAVEPGEPREQQPRRPEPAHDGLAAADDADDDAVDDRAGEAAPESGGSAAEPTRGVVGRMVLRVTHVGRRNDARSGETRQRSKSPSLDEAERETRLTPAEAIDADAHSRLRCARTAKLEDADRAHEQGPPAQGLVAGRRERGTPGLARMEINDHSWVHIQIVRRTWRSKLLRQLTKHGVDPAMVVRLRNDAASDTRSGRSR